MSTGFKGGGVQTPADQALRQAKGRRAAAEDAPDAVPEGHVPYEESARFRAEERRQTRVRIAVLGVALAAVVFVTLCERPSYGDFISPGAMLDSLAALVQWKTAEVFRLELMSHIYQFVNVDHPYVYSVFAQLRSDIVLGVGGAMLALAGMLFQNVFRNPLAAPNMLGVSAGTNLAVTVLVAMFGGLAMSMTYQRYALSFALGAVLLVLVLVLSRVSSPHGKGFNVGNIVLVGTLMSSLTGSIVTYLVLQMDDQTLLLYEAVQEMFTLDTSAVTFAVLLAASIVTFVPLYIRRFNFNVLSCSDAEMRLFGVNPGRTRLLALCIGTVMMLVAQVLCGTVSMITLVVPFISRAIFGSEFRKQTLGNVFIGSALLVAAKNISMFFPLGYTDTGLVFFPTSLAIAIVLLPALVYIVVTVQRAWE